MRLSVYFTTDEFACHSGEEVPAALMPNLQRLHDGVLLPLREKAGPLAVISGYRTPEYNARVGGAKASTHMQAMAADIRPTRGVSVQELHDTVLAMHKAGQLPALGGLGLYKTWIHVDVNKAADGHLRRWTGTGTGSEQ